MTLPSENSKLPTACFEMVRMTDRPRRIPGALAWLLLPMTLVGCGERLEATVSGKVTLDGAVVFPGRITFAPSDIKQAPAVGKLETDGSYSLSTNRIEGALAGEYRVAIQSYEAVKGLKPGERHYGPTPALVPEKYLQVATSGLSYTVEPGSNTIDIELVSE